MSWRILFKRELWRIVLNNIIIAFLIGLAISLTYWFITEKRAEITLKLDSWIAIGELLEGAPRGFRLGYRGRDLKNAIKISWLIVNTGSKGIPEFETYPSLVYPEGVDIVEAGISETSPLLIIDKNVLIDSEKRTIKVNDMGLFNEKDFFKVDVYMIDVPDSLVLSDYLETWDLEVKAVDLKVETNIKYESETESSIWERIMGAMSGIVLISIAVIFFPLLLVRIYLSVLALRALMFQTVWEDIERRKQSIRKI